MAQRRPYNPYTKYGRRKMRQQAHYNISQYTPEQKAEYNKINTIIWLVIIGLVLMVLFIMVATGHEDAAMKWISH